MTSISVGRSRYFYQFIVAFFNIIQAKNVEQRD